MNERNQAMSMQGDTTGLRLADVKKQLKKDLMWASEFKQALNEVYNLTIMIKENKEAYEEARKEYRKLLRRIVARKKRLEDLAWYSKAEANIRLPKKLKVEKERLFLNQYVRDLFELGQQLAKKQAALGLPSRDESTPIVKTSTVDQALLVTQKIDVIYSWISTFNLPTVSAQIDSYYQFMSAPNKTVKEDQWLVSHLTDDNKWLNDVKLYSANIKELEAMRNEVNTLLAEIRGKEGDLFIEGMRSALTKSMNDLEEVIEQVQARQVSNDMMFDQAMVLTTWSEQKKRAPKPTKPIEEATKVENSLGSFLAMEIWHREIIRRFYTTVQPDLRTYSDVSTFVQEEAKKEELEQSIEITDKKIETAENAVEIAICKQTMSQTLWVEATLEKPKNEFIASARLFNEEVEQSGDQLLSVYEETSGPKPVVTLPEPVLELATIVKQVKEPVLGEPTEIPAIIESELLRRKVEKTQRKLGQKEKEILEETREIKKSFAGLEGFLKPITQLSKKSEISKAVTDIQHLVEEGVSVADLSEADRKLRSLQVEILRNRQLLEEYADQAIIYYDLFQKLNLKPEYQNEQIKALEERYDARVSELALLGSLFKIQSKMLQPSQELLDKKRTELHEKIEYAHAIVEKANKVLDAQPVVTLGQNFVPHLEDLIEKLKSAENFDEMSIVYNDIRNQMALVSKELGDVRKHVAALEQVQKNLAHIDPRAFSLTQLENLQKKALIQIDHDQETIKLLAENRHRSEVIEIQVDKIFQLKVNEHLGEFQRYFAKTITYSDRMPRQAFDVVDSINKLNRLIDLVKKTKSEADKNDLRFVFRKDMKHNKDSWLYQLGEFMASSEELKGQSLAIAIYLNKQYDLKRHINAQDLTPAQLITVLKEATAEYPDAYLESAQKQFQQLSDFVSELPQVESPETIENYIDAFNTTIPNFNASLSMQHLRKYLLLLSQDKLTKAQEKWLSETVAKDNPLLSEIQYLDQHQTRMEKVKDAALLLARDTQLDTALENKINAFVNDVNKIYVDPAYDQLRDLKKIIDHWRETGDVQRSAMQQQGLSLVPLVKQQRDILQSQLAEADSDYFYKTRIQSSLDQYEKLTKNKKDIDTLSVGLVKHLNNVISANTAADFEKRAVEAKDFLNTNAETLQKLQACYRELDAYRQYITNKQAELKIANIEEPPFVPAIMRVLENDSLKELLSDYSELNKSLRTRLDDIKQNKQYAEKVQVRANLLLAQEADVDLFEQSLDQFNAAVNNIRTIEVEGSTALQSLKENYDLAKTKGESTLLLADELKKYSDNLKNQLTVLNQLEASYIDATVKKELFDQLTERLSATNKALAEKAAGIAALPTSIQTLELDYNTKVQSVLQKTAPEYASLYAELKSIEGRLALINVAEDLSQFKGYFYLADQTPLTNAQEAVVKELFRDDACIFKDVEFIQAQRKVLQEIRTKAISGEQSELVSAVDDILAQVSQTEFQELEKQYKVLLAWKSNPSSRRKVHEYNVLRKAPVSFADIAAKTAFFDIEQVTVNKGKAYINSLGQMLGTQDVSTLLQTVNNIKSVEYFIDLFEQYPSLQAVFKETLSIDSLSALNAAQEKVQQLSVKERGLYDLTMTFFDDYLNHLKSSTEVFNSLGAEEGVCAKSHLYREQFKPQLEDDRHKQTQQAFDQLTPLLQAVSLKEKQALLPEGKELEEKIRQDEALEKSKQVVSEITEELAQFIETTKAGFTTYDESMQSFKVNLEHLPAALKSIDNVKQLNELLKEVGSKYSSIATEQKAIDGKLLPALDGFEKRLLKAAEGQDNAILEQPLAAVARVKTQLTQYSDQLNSARDLGETKDEVNPLIEHIVKETLKNLQDEVGSLDEIEKKIKPVDALVINFIDQVKNITEIDHENPEVQWLMQYAGKTELMKNFSQLFDSISVDILKKANAYKGQLDNTQQLLSIIDLVNNLVEGNIKQAEAIYKGAAAIRDKLSIESADNGVNRLFLDKEEAKYKKTYTDARNETIIQMAEKLANYYLDSADLNIKNEPIWLDTIAQARKAYIHAESKLNSLNALLSNPDLVNHPLQQYLEEQRDLFKEHLSKLSLVKEGQFVQLPEYQTSLNETFIQFLESIEQSKPDFLLLDRFFTNPDLHGELTSNPMALSRFRNLNNVAMQSVVALPIEEIKKTIPAEMSDTIFETYVWIAYLCLEELKTSQSVNEYKKFQFLLDELNSKQDIYSEQLSIQAQTALTDLLKMKDKDVGEILKSSLISLPTGIDLSSEQLENNDRLLFIPQSVLNNGSVLLSYATQYSQTNSELTATYLDELYTQENNNRYLFGTPESLQQFANLEVTSTHDQVTKLVNISHRLFLENITADNLKKYDPGKSNSCPAISNYTKYYENLTYTIHEDIKSRNTRKEQMFHFERWLSIADQCLQQGDYATFISIFSALDKSDLIPSSKQGATAIETSDSYFDSLDCFASETKKKFQDLYNLVDKRNSFGLLKKRIRESEGSMVPIIAYIFSDFNSMKELAKVSEKVKKSEILFIEKTLAWIKEIRGQLPEEALSKAEADLYTRVIGYQSKDTAKRLEDYNTKQKNKSKQQYELLALKRDESQSVSAIPAKSINDSFTISLSDIHSGKLISILLERDLQFKAGVTKKEINKLNLFLQHPGPAKELKNILNSMGIILDDVDVREIKQNSLLNLFQTESTKEGIIALLNKRDKQTDVSEIKSRGRFGTTADAINKINQALSAEKGPRILKAEFAKLNITVSDDEVADLISIHNIDNRLRAMKLDDQAVEQLSVQLDQYDTPVSDNLSAKQVIESLGSLNRNTEDLNQRIVDLNAQISDLRDVLERISASTDDNAVLFQVAIDDIKEKLVLCDTSQATLVVLRGDYEHVSDRYNKVLQERVELEKENLESSEQELIAVADDVSNVTEFSNKFDSLITQEISGRYGDMPLDKSYIEHLAELYTYHNYCITQDNYLSQHEVSRGFLKELERNWIEPLKVANAPIPQIISDYDINLQKALRQVDEMRKANKAADNKIGELIERDIKTLYLSLEKEAQAINREAIPLFNKIKVYKKYQKLTHNDKYATEAVWQELLAQSVDMTLQANEIWQKFEKIKTVTGINFSNLSSFNTFDKTRSSLNIIQDKAYDEKLPDWELFNILLDDNKVLDDYLSTIGIAIKFGGENISVENFNKLTADYEVKCKGTISSSTFASAPEKQLLFQIMKERFSSQPRPLGTTLFLELPREIASKEKRTRRGSAAEIGESIGVQWPSQPEKEEKSFWAVIGNYIKPTVQPLLSLIGFEIKKPEPTKRKVTKQAFKFEQEDRVVSQDLQVEINKEKRALERDIGVSDEEKKKAHNDSGPMTPAL